MVETVIFIFEIIGTIAFSISGAIVAIEKKMDVLGVMILGLTTGVGGGVIRDVVIGNTPAQAFTSPIYSLISIVVALIIFLPPVREWVMKENKFFQSFLLITDSIGLGIFTVVGIATAYAVVPEHGLFLLVFVGTVTGVGGGVMRDIMAGNTPYIFVKHFYACASIIGALVCSFIWDMVGSVPAMFVGTGTVVVLRILAATFRWELPRAE